jgi:hypothetical protein
MDTTNTKSRRVQLFYFFSLLLIISIVFSVALVIWVECFLRALALEQHQRTFPSTIVLVTESVPPKTVEQLAAQGFNFPTLPAPFTREELHEAVFGDAQVSEAW